MSDDEQAIRQLVQDWMDFTRRGEFDRVLNLMTDDALFLTPGQKPFGKIEFGEHSESSRGVRIEGSNEIQELYVSGKWAWMRSAITITATPPEGEPVRRSGYTLTVLRKGDDGHWRLFRDANLMS